MFQSIRIAIRNITRQKKRSVMLGAAVAFGFLVITMVNGLTAGILVTTKNNFSHTFGGHVYISGTVVSDLGTELALIEDDSAARAAIATLGDRVKSVHYRSRSNGSLYFGTNVRSLKLEGVDFSDEKDFGTSVEVSRGNLADIDVPGAIILPDDTARKLGVEIGESVIYKASTISGQQNIAEFTLVATTVSGGFMPMETGYTGKDSLNALLDLDRDAYQKINVYLSDVEEVAGASAALYDDIASRAPVESRVTGGSDGSMQTMKRMFGMDSRKAVAMDDRWIGTKYAVSTIEDIMKPVLALVSIMNSIAFAVFIVLLLIIMVGILNSYRMIMIERTAEIGTMRAIGVRRKGIRDIFLVEALTVSALGALGGLVLSLLLGFLVTRLDFGTTSFFSVFLSRGHFAYSLSLIETSRNFLIICVMSLAAVYLPARKASKLEPAEALRVSY